MKRFSPIIRDQIIWWMWQNNLQLFHRQLKGLVNSYTNDWLNNYYYLESGSYLRILDELYFKNREEIDDAYLNIIKTFLATKPNFKNSETWLQAKYIDNNYRYDEMLAELMELFTDLKDYMFIEDLCRKACFEWKIRNFTSFMHTDWTSDDTPA